jgi:hypothetical protein
METETLVNHPVLSPTDSATEDRTPLKVVKEEKENHLGCMTMPLPAYMYIEEDGHCKNIHVFY